MSKSIVTRLFVGSLIAIVGGVVVVVFGLLLAIANASIVISEREIRSVAVTPVGWSMIAVALVGGLAVVGGAIGQFVAWIGAVLNTARLDDKTWFVLLLVLGLLSFGFVAMIVYVLAGPDGMPAPRSGDRLAGHAVAG
jgi:hypothetical protein